MNLDYRSTQCPLGKIANFFPGTQNWAVFQWTTKLPGMLARVFVFLLPCKGNLMQGRVPWKRCIFPFSVDSLPHIEYCHNFSGTEHKLSSLFQLWYFKKNLNINFFPGILSFFTDTSFFFFFPFGKRKWGSNSEPSALLRNFLLAYNDYSYLRWKLSGHWAVKQLFSFCLRRLIDLSQASRMVLGGNSCIGAAINGSRQHHETHNPTHHPCDDDGGHGVAQIGWPRLGFDLTLPVVSLPWAVVLRGPGYSLVGST